MMIPNFHELKRRKTKLNVQDGTGSISNKQNTLPRNELLCQLFRGLK